MAPFEACLGIDTNQPVPSVEEITAGVASGLYPPYAGTTQEEWLQWATTSGYYETYLAEREKAEQSALPETDPFKLNPKLLEEDIRRQQEQEQREQEQQEQQARMEQQAQQEELTPQEYIPGTPGGGAIDESDVADSTPTVREGKSLVGPVVAVGVGILATWLALR